MTFQFFQRYFFSRRAGAVIRSMARICTIATFLGAMSLITVSSIMEGFNRSIRTKLLGVDPHLTVMASQGTPTQWREDLTAELRQSMGAEVNPFTQQDVIVRTIDGAFSGAVAKGLSSEALLQFLNRVHKLRYKNSQAPELDPAEAELSINEVLIGSDLARTLNLFEGDEFMVISPESLLGPAGESPKLERLRVKSLVTTEFPEIDSKLIVYLMKSVPRRFESVATRVQGLEIRLKDVGQIATAQDLLSRQFSDYALTTETWMERNRALFMALRLEKFAMSTFLFLSVLITCFSPITLLAMLISQKRKEIGLMMAMGFSKGHVRRMFFQIGFLLAGSGLFLGVAGGVLISWLLQRYPVEILPDIYYDTVLPSVINWGTVIGVSLFCFLVAFFAAYLPANRTTFNEPADNLRHQTGT